MDPDSLNRLATEHYRSGNLRMAVNALTTALKLDPEHVDSHLNVASLLLEAHQVDLAQMHSKRAVALAPRRYESLLGMGLVVRARDRSTEAVEWLTRAEAAAPNRREAPMAIGTISQEMAQPAQAIAAFERALRWHPSDAELLSNRLFAMNFLPDFDPAASLAAHRDYERRIRAPRPAPPRPRRARHDGGLLRIGYVSGDLRNHAVARFLLPVLRRHDPSRVHVTAYYTGRIVDAVTREIAGLCGAFRQVATMTDDALIRQIADDGIDALVDLSGHSAGNRLPVFAARAAPLQATWMGYLGSTGLSAMDVRLTDAYADPVGASEAWHSERIIRLPETMWTYEPYPDAPDPSDAPASDAPASDARSGAITFGVLSNPAKYSDEALATWASILAALPASRLRIMSRDDAALRERILDAFRAAGIDETRVTLLGKTSPRDYLDLYADIDILLDTFPVSGGTTVCDALWQGVPTLAVRSLRPYGATAASVLHQVGVDDWVVDSGAALVERAVAVARDYLSAARGTLRAALRERLRRSPLMDGTSVARAVEATLVDAWSAKIG